VAWTHKYKGNVSIRVPSYQSEEIKVGIIFNIARFLSADTVQELVK